MPSRARTITRRGASAPKLNADRRRGTAVERGYGYQWQLASKRFLRENPLCRSCEAKRRIKPATITDHIVPHRGDQSLFWDPSNWQPLCKPCHDQKTAQGQ